MRNKKLLFYLLLAVILIILIISYLYISNKSNLSKIDEIYLISSKMVIENKKQDVISLNEVENIIYNYFENVYNEKKEIIDDFYDNYIRNNNIYVNIDDVSDELNKYVDSEKELLDSLNNYSKKQTFIKYLKSNKVNFIYTSYLNIKISDKNLFDLKDITENVNLDIEKYNTLIKYIKYLKENKDDWKYEDNRVLCKNVDILNTIKEKNKELGINIKVIMAERSNKNIPVLMYHGVSDTTWGIASLFMRVSDFEEQLKYIHDNYETIFIEDIEDYYGDSKVVALTFDDGYVDFYTNVLPLLKKYNLKANLYIITGTKNEKYLNEEQILEINNSGLVSIGSHTVNHSNLDSINMETLTAELKLSKEYLEKLLGKEIKTICYPTGAYNSKVLEETAKYYDYGLIIGGTVETMNGNFNRVAIKRYRVYRNTGFNNFTKMVDSAT